MELDFFEIQGLEQIIIIQYQAKIEQVKEQHRGNGIMERQERQRPKSFRAEQGHGQGIDELELRGMRDYFVERTGKQEREDENAYHIQRLQGELRDVREILAKRAKGQKEA